VIKEGDFFGEKAIFHLLPRSASILCKTDCVFYVLSFKRITEALRDL
jgi:CRP-like cAMP-binding protein